MVGDDARVLVTAQVTDDFFPVLGVAPAVGAAFTPDDFQRAQFNSAAAPVGADPVVILSHGCGNSRLAPTGPLLADR